MSTRTISTVLKLENEAQYRAALKSSASELKSLKSELELVSSEYRNNANSMDALTAKGEVLSKMCSVQEQRVTTLRGALEKAKETRDAEQKAVDDAREQYAKAEQTLASFGDEVDKSSEKYRNTKADLEKWRDEVIKHEARLNASTVSVNQYGAQLNRAEIELNNLSDRQDENNRLLAEAENAADHCATSIDRYGDAVRDAADGTGKSVSAVEALSSAMVASGIQQKVEDVAAAMMECSEAAASYELSLAKVSTIADTSVLSMDSMRTDILEMSSAMGKSAEEIAEASYQALSAGVDTANVLDFTRQATQLSVAGFTDSATSVDVLTTVLNAYGLSAEQTEAVASKLIKTQDLGKITVDDLGKVLGRVIPLAAAYGVNLDNVAAAYARMTASGVNAENSTTYLSTMLDELADSGSTVATVLKEQTGKTFAELMASGASLGDVLEIIGQSVQNDSVQFAGLWSSATAGKAALALFNSGAEAFNATLNEMASSSGSVAANYAKMTENSDYASRRMPVASQNLKIAVGDQLNPILNKLRAAGAGILETAANIVAQNPLLVSVITGVVTALGLLAAGLSGLMIVKSVTAAMAALNITMMANPAVLVAVGIAGLVGAIATFVAQAEDATTQVEAMTEASRNLAETVEAGNQSYEDAVVSAEAAANTVDHYIDRLEELEAQGLETDAQQMEYRMILDQINALMPGINAEIDNQTELVRGGTAALRDNAAAWKQAALQEAAYARYKDDVAAMADAQYELAKNQALANMAETDAEIIKEKLEQNTKALNAAYARQEELLANTTGDAAEWSAAMSQTNEEIASLQMETSRLNDELAENEQYQQGLKAAIEEGNATIAENQLQVAAATEAYNAFSTQIEGAMEGAGGAVGNATGSILGDLAAIGKGYVELWAEARESLGNQIDLLDDMSGKCESSTGDMIKNLQSQREAFDNYATNLTLAIQRGVDVGLVQQLSDGSKESMQIIAELVNSTDEQIAELNEAFNGAEEAKENASETMSALQYAYNEGMTDLMADMVKNGVSLGSSLVDGLIQGINGKKTSYTGAVASLANAGTSRYKQVNMIYSPSRRWKELAKHDVEGLTTQYQQDTPKVKMAAAKMADAGYTASIRARKAAIPSLTAAVSAPGPVGNTQEMQLLQKILAAIQSGKTIVLDSGALVGSTVGQYDTAMGQRQILVKRGAI